MDSLFFGIDPSIERLNHWLIAFIEFEWDWRPRTGQGSTVVPTKMTHSTLSMTQWLNVSIQ
jgi:hypothetical protein